MLCNHLPYLVQKHSRHLTGDSGSSSSPPLPHTQPAQTPCTHFLPLCVCASWRFHISPIDGIILYVNFLSALSLLMVKMEKFMICELYHNLKNA